MYQIYKSEGIVLGSSDFSEANKFIYIFTEEFGLISATAQSVRQIKSKLRSSLQKFSIVNLVLIRGRETWRITNTEFKQNLYYEFRQENKKLKVVINVLFLVKKLLAGEKHNEKLYKIIRKTFSFFEKNNLNPSEISAFENILLIRILHNLGYFDVGKQIRGQNIYERIVENDLYDYQVLLETETLKKDIIPDINEALLSTDLF